jgi:cyclophilin family peptidyl-prolyl cis-trans isomerase
MNKKYSSGLFLFVSVLILQACSVLKGGGGKASDPTKDTLVVIGTKFGEMTLVLFPETPEHRKNFLKLAGQKFYDSTTFHRIIKDFMIQGGDPNSKDDNPNNDGQGGPGYTIPGEFNPLFSHVQGALAAARMGDQVNPEKRSSGSQFYLVEKSDGTHFLDKNYSVYGQTIKGIEVIQTIAIQPKNQMDRPNSDIKMWVKLLPMKKQMVTETYGYDYPSHTVKPELIKRK